ncbi:Pvc16 family protein [Parabacteroides sp. OttesenSCG-928-G06]|nr:Pvc16 family protein [Parabacteroides sp. OttesenSCG-928-K15]MDL2282167.1 Pvc16 family protein [Parabacteroides sp. OttesenSCG-928-G06]
MIYTCLSHISNLLNEYLDSYYESMENQAEVGAIRSFSTVEIPNKIIFSFINMERETGIGNAVTYQSAGDNRVQQTNSPWYFTLTFLMAAVYDEKRYTESVEKLSTSIAFLQQNSTIRFNNNLKFTIEPITLNIQELSNLWGIMGGHHYPAFFGKIRLLTFDSEQISRTASRILQPHTEATPDKQ